MSVVKLCVSAVLVLLFSSIMEPCDAARILLTPGDHPAHVKSFALTGQTLKAAGHDIYIMANKRHQKLLEGFDLNNILLTLEDVTVFTKDYDKFEKAMFEKVGVMWKSMNLAKTMMPQMKAYCHGVLGNQELMSQIEHLKFDLAIMEGFDLFRCIYILPYRYDIPYVTITPRADPWTVRVSALPSVEGMGGLFLINDQSSFLDRLANLAAYVAIDIMGPYMNTLDDSFITQYAPEKPSTTFTDLYLKSEMWFNSLDSICLEYPRVTAPHYKFVGSIGSHPAKPLPKDLEEFVSGADDGIVLMTFGSAIKRASPEMLEKFFYAFGQLSQRVVMRYDTDTNDVPDNIPANVKLAKWLPQNDLLGHPKTRLFITHGGNNGQLETLYHGVPFVVMPFFGDQWYNADRGVLRQYGLKLNPFDFTSEQLLAAVREVLDNPKYRNNIQKCSKIYHSLPTAQETIAFWVEHVLEYGSSHLKPNYINMPLWKYFMFDILLFFIIFFLVFGGMLYLCARCFYRKCCSSRGSTKPKSE